MIELEIEVSTFLDDSTVAAAIQDACKEEALALQMQTSLKKFPGCTHWHFKHSTERGILEITWWPGQNEKRAARLWLSVHGNRRAAWADKMMPQLKVALDTRLNVSP